MAILHLSIRPSEHCIVAICRSKILKFWILLKGYIKINDKFGFFDSLSISSEMDFGLGPSKHSKAKIFFIIFHHFSRISPISLKFRVDPMLYFGSLNH
jgi:hypothetical protein